MDLLEMLRMNLQFFSSPDDGGGNNPSDNQDDPKDDNPVEDNPTDDKDKKPEKTFTQEEVNKLVQERVKRLERDKEAAVKEAEKLAKMSADQKKEYEFEKQQRENEELKARINRYELGKEATSILAESGIIADDEILDFVVKEDAEKTNEAVKAFTNLVDRVADDIMKEKLRGKAPKKQIGKQPSMTKEEILKIQDGAERIRAIQANSHLFN